MKKLHFEHKTSVREKKAKLGKDRNYEKSIGFPY